MRTDLRALREPLIQLFVVPVAFFLGAKLSLAFAVPPDTLVLFWIPNSVLLVATLHFGFRRWPAFAIGVLAAELAADWGSFAPLPALLFGAINLAEVVAALLLLRRWRFDPGLQSPVDLAKFIVAAPGIASLAASAAAAAVYRWVAGATTPFLEIGRVWWFADGLGLLVLSPLLLTFLPPAGASPHLRRPRLRAYDLLAAAGALAIVSAFSLARERHIDGVTVRAFLLIVPAIWVAARFDLRATSLAVFALTLVALESVRSGRQPFGDVSLAETATSIQELIAVLATTALGLSALLSQLRHAGEELERQVRDRTAELRQANQQLEALAVRDPLTGCLNRRGLETVLRREHERARRHRRPLALILFDVDRFKSVNDRHGHDVGDAVLRHLVAVVGHQVRGSDAFARMGGEEFVIAAPELDEPGALALAERIRVALGAAPLRIGELALRATASFGVAVAEPAGGDLDELFQRADRALYLAKQTGRDRVVVASALHSAHAG